MKVMNEIKSDRAGVVKEILVKDGVFVEYDQSLFVIE
jgi:acetyl-CoA carboxylase biotin carboxyl carrier protein